VRGGDLEGGGWNRSRRRQEAGTFFNALGPFTVGQVVTIITEVSNSVATRTTAPRTITIGVPVT